TNNAQVILGVGNSVSQTEITGLEFTCEGTLEGNILGFYSNQGIDGNSIIVSGAYVNKLAEEGYMTENTNVAGMVRVSAKAAARVNSTVYKTVTEALAVAQSGETVVMLDNSVEGNIVVPAYITLYLNGKTLEAKYVASFGQVIDSTDGEGALKVEFNKVYLSAENQQLPLYNVADGVYKFFTVEIVSKAIGKNDGNTVVLAYQLLFNNAEAYSIIAKGGSGITIALNIDWKKSVGPIYYTFSEAVLKQFAAAAPGQISQKGKVTGGVTLTINGLSTLPDAATTLDVTSTVKTKSGVSIVGETINHAL
ncbi:MAG: hypothetical protein IKU44_00910, partial [Firmicutes bacterium]|nr:hypothetical protein [Bacillota bacterium]